MPADVSITNRHAAQRANIVLGEDWDRPSGAVESELRAARQRRSMIALNRSPLARKIILFNLLAIVVLVAGVMYLNPFRDSLVEQRERALAVEAQLIAEVFQATLEANALDAPEAAAEPPVDIEDRVADQQADMARVLGRIGLADGVDVFLFTPQGGLIASTEGIASAPSRPVRGLTTQSENPLLITDFLNSVWGVLSNVFGAASVQQSGGSHAEFAARLVPSALEGATILQRGASASGTAFATATVIEGPGGPIAVLSVTTAAGEIDDLVRVEREQLLQMFVVALLVSIGLSLVLASTIANPLSDLAAAAELGRDKNARKMSPTRVRIPDLTGRPDEIGRLSEALRGMVAALYDRIDANEQFAADVSHEIKNPLASLRSAVGTMRVARTDEQRGRLLEVIEHDVQRLDRLVSDISNASRLDSELVKEEEQEFDLVKMLGNLSQYHGEEAGKKGVDFITDLPSDPIVLSGLEGRLAQVFVNLLSNAISFCDDGDAVRLWTRCRENRVLIVVEDTGPGIPEEALTKVFNRFYSERPVQQFGNHSGLGLAISKQIVEAHGGVIWAENIRPTDFDAASEPLGARFVVGLPL